MSRLTAAVLGISLLWAAPVAAQDSLALLVRMEARLDSLRRAAARVDSLGYTSSATDSVIAGGIRIATSAALRPFVELAAAEAWDSLEARFGASALAVQTLPVILFGGPGTVVPESMDRQELARGLEGAAAQSIWRRQDPVLTTWLMGSFPTGSILEEELQSIASELARRPARQNTQCLRGEASACAVALGLRMGADTLAEWYAETTWPRLAETSVWSLTGRDAQLRDRCVALRDLMACRAVLTPQRIAPPVSTLGRRFLVELALEAGGAGAFDRLTADTGRTLEQRLEAAAGVPVDTLLARWTASVAASIPGSPAPGGRETFLTMAWSAAVMVMAIRGSRWR